MTTIASRDLRNHTASVLRHVADGTDVTVTVHGEPVALITRPRQQRRAGLPRAEFVALMEAQDPDTALAADLAWITEGSTDDLGPIE